LIYEPISSGFRIARAKLSRLSGVLDDYVVRSTTAEKLNLLIQDVMTLPMH
jgi:hypothetical protein